MMQRPTQTRLRLPRVMELPPVQGDEPPFLRPARRTHVRRARRGLLGRSIVALEITGGALVAALALWTGYAQVMASDRLKVARVEVRGSRFLSEGEVRELLGPAVGENILGLDIQALKARLRASAWVADATVTRTLPDTLRVEVVERAPLALAEVERLYLMDGDGVLIDMYGPRTAAFDLPIVRGLARADVEARRDRAQRAGALLRDLGELAAEVSEVEVESTGDLKVVLRGAGEILRLGAPPYRSRLLTFLTLRRELNERCPDAEYFDLRFRDRIYAKTAPRPQPAATSVPLPVPSAAPPVVAPAPLTVPAVSGGAGTAAPSGASPAPDARQQKTNPEAAPLGGVI
jgi:cell division protein FtsQ